MEILKKDILKEMEEKSKENLDKGIDIAVSILKHEYPFVIGWKYNNKGYNSRYTVYINLICDLDKSSEFYNSPIKKYYYDRGESNAPYPFFPLKLSDEIDNDEKYRLFSIIQKSFNEIYDEIPDEYRYLITDYISTDVVTPKEIYLEGFNFPAPEKLSESEYSNDKVSLAKSLIQQLFDEVSFIEQSTYNDRPLLTVYFDSDDTAANIESVFTHEICGTIKDYTSGEIKCNPSWGPKMRTLRNNPDILIDAILLKYDDEGNVLNENKLDDLEEETNYVPIIEEIIEPFKNEDCVCDIDVLYDEEDDMYSVYPVFSAEELNDKFFNFDGNVTYRNKLVREIKAEIKTYLPIDNLYVGSYGKPNCRWSPLNESKERPNKEVIINIINELILPNYKDDICGFEYIDKDERLDLMGNTSFNQSKLTITFIGERPERHLKRDKYHEIMNDIWNTLYDYSGVAVDLYARYTDKCEKEKINESVMGPEFLDIIKDIVEVYKQEDTICDIEVSYDDEDGMYSIYIIFDSEELLKIRDRGAYARQIRNRIGEDIVKYIPDFMNFYAGSYVRHCKESINENWFKIPSSEFGPLEKIINLEMKEKYSWWKDIKINTLNYIELYGDVQIEAELTVDEEWGANQWREFYQISQFPGNKGWEDDGYELVRFGDIIDSTYAYVIRHDLEEIFKYTLNIDVNNMSFRNVYLIFE